MKRKTKKHKSSGMMRTRETVEPNDLVNVLDEKTGEKFEYILTASRDADPFSDPPRISTDSLVGRGLLGKRLNDKCEVKTPEGIQHYRILSIRPGEEVSSSKEDSEQKKDCNHCRLLRNDECAGAREICQYFRWACGYSKEELESFPSSGMASRIRDAKGKYERTHGNNTKSAHYWKDKDGRMKFN